MRKRGTQEEEGIHLPRHCRDTRDPETQGLKRKHSPVGSASSMLGIRGPSSLLLLLT